jgi:hypothetical protein
VTRFTPRVKELLRAAGCRRVRQGRGVSWSLDIVG